MIKFNKKFFIIFIIFCLSTLLIQFTLSKYSSIFNRTVSLNVSKPTYTVVFHSNTTTDTTTVQNFVYGVSQNLDANSFTYSGHNFIGWNTEPDGSGTSYTNGELVSNLSQVNNATIDLYAQWSQGVARIGNVYYNTIHAAVAAVPTDNTPTTIQVLANIVLGVNDRITIVQDKNIIFDFQNFTLSNENGANIPLFENSGTMTISNGIFRSSASQAVINNDEYGTVTVTGGDIAVTGSKQAIYNNGGMLEISGNPIIKNNSSNRATVHNLNNGTMTITGGTIINNNNYYAVKNEATMTIGDKDGVVNKNSPIIQGYHGIYSDYSFDFYDGIIKARYNYFNDPTLVDEVEDNCEFVESSEKIGSITYKTTWLTDDIITITFDGNGGTPSEASRRIDKNASLGSLPTATYTNNIFQGWYTDPTAGTQVTASTPLDHAQILYAHWVPAKATMNGRMYTTVQSAVYAAPNNTETTITVLGDSTEYIQIGETKRIILDIQSATLRNNGVSTVINNKGYLKIISGTITSNTTQGAINNRAGATLEITGGSVIATGTRQAIYNEGGTVVISGTAYFSAVSVERATVHNLAGGNMTILGGTIVSENQQAVNNLGTLTVGDKDGTIDATTPVFIGKTYGITNTGTFNFYDGIIKGYTDAISGNVAEIEDNSTIVTSSEVIDTLTYTTNYLASTP